MPHDDASLPTANPDLTVVEKRVLSRIFQHPLSHNLSWREVFVLFRAVGSVEYSHKGDVALKLCQIASKRDPIIASNTDPVAA